MVRVGTCHFESLPAAVAYYRRQGDCSVFDATKDVFAKLDAGEIHIGVPPIKEGERVEIIAGEGRYAIIEEGKP